MRVRCVYPISRIFHTCELTQDYSVDYHEGIGTAGEPEISAFGSNVHINIFFPVQKNHTKNSMFYRCFTDVK